MSTMRRGPGASKSSARTNLTIFGGTQARSFAAADAWRNLRTRKPRVGRVARPAGTGDGRSKRRRPKSAHKARWPAFNWPRGGGPSRCESSAHLIVAAVAIRRWPPPAGDLLSIAAPSRSSLSAHRINRRAAVRVGRNIAARTRGCSSGLLEGETQAASNHQETTGHSGDAAQQLLGRRRALMGRNV